MRTKIITLGRFLLLVLAIFSSHAFADNQIFTINQVYPKGTTAIAGQTNEYTFLVRNNSTNPIDFNITTSSLLHIDQYSSTCSKQLPANKSCHLTLAFLAPNTTGPVNASVTVNIAGNQIINKQLTFAVVNKNKVKNLSANQISLNWQLMPGPFGGDVRSTVASLDGATLYTAVYRKGVYQSTNGGKSWILLANNNLNPYVTKLLVLSDAIYAVTYEGGLYKTTDQGQNWTAINNGLPSSANDLVFANNNLYTVTNDDSPNGSGVFVSTDEGVNWSSTGAFPVPGDTLNAILVQGNTFYVGTSAHGIYQSLDGGKSWSQINNGLNQMNITSLITSNGVVYAGSLNYNGNCGVFKSTDSGKTWVRADNGLGSRLLTGFAVSGNIIYASTSHGVYKTTDGSNWTNINNGLSYLSVASVTVNNSILFANTEGGVYQSVDGGNNWNNINTGILANYITGLLALPNGIVYAGTSAGGVFKSINNGLTWTLTMQGINLGTSGDMSNFVADNNNNIYMVSGKNGFDNVVYQTNINGSSWQALNPPTDQWGGTIAPASLLVNGSNLYLGSLGSAVYVTADDGADWQSLTPQEDNEFSVSSMALIGKNFYASNWDDIYALQLGSDGSWNDAFGDLSRPININAIQIVNNVIAPVPYVLTNQGIFYTFNGGKEWLPSSGGLPSDANVIGLVANVYTFIAGTTNYGIFISFDSGENWVPANNGLPESDIQMVANNGNYLFAALASGGFYRTKVSTLLKH